MNKTYAFTDLHGNYTLWEQIRDYCDDTDLLYYLGDAIDRGPAGLKIMNELLRDERVIYIKGNHEQFLEAIGPELIDDVFDNLSLWYQNGGQKTVENFFHLQEPIQRDYIKRVKGMFTECEYINAKGQAIFLSHAGYSPWKTPTKEKDFLWDREHFYDSWDKSELYKDAYVVHGHTPVSYLALQTDSKIPVDKHGIWEPLVYSDGHKIDLDLGSFVTGKAVLFDLDKLEVAARFYDKEAYNEE